MAVDFEDEDGGAADPDLDRFHRRCLCYDGEALDRDDLFAGAALLAREVEDDVDVLVVDAGEDRRAAAPEETAGAGDLRRREAARD